MDLWRAERRPALLFWCVLALVLLVVEVAVVALEVLLLLFSAFTALFVRRAATSCRGCPTASFEGRTLFRAHARVQSELLTGDVPQGLKQLARGIYHHRTTAGRLGYLGRSLADSFYDFHPYSLVLLQ